MDYATIERQALARVLTETAGGTEGPVEITQAKRDWTNAARREIQRAHDFPEMLALYPAEAALGIDFTLPAGERSAVLPARFKAFASERGDLWRIEDGVHIPLDKRDYEAIVAEWDLDDTGPPEVFHLIRTLEGDVNTVEVYPKPDVATPLRLHGYFYLEDIAAATEDSDPAENAEDFLSRLDPYAVRDYICQQAYMELEMWDSAARMGAAAAGRVNALVNDAVLRQIRPGEVLAPSFRSGERQRGGRERQGYGFWGR